MILNQLREFTRDYTRLFQGRIQGGQEVIRLLNGGVALLPPPWLESLFPHLNYKTSLRNTFKYKFNYSYTLELKNLFQIIPHFFKE